MAPKSHPFHLDAESLFAPFSRPCLLCWFYVEFGSLWAHFWLPLAHFWLPLASFWRHLASFWHPLPHFWPIWDSFWLTFGVVWLTFNISWSLFSYFYVLSMKMSCKIVFYYFFQVFRHPISQNTCRLIEGATLRKALFLCTASSPPWPGAEPWLCQLRLIDTFYYSLTKLCL